MVGCPGQFFRRAAWQQIDGYMPWGQEDAIAQMMARMHGWRIRSFDDLRVLHHKTAKEKSRHPLNGRFHTGKMERAMGYHPLYEAAKCLGQLRKKPIILGSLAQLYGYTWAAWKNIRTELGTSTNPVWRRGPGYSRRRAGSGRGSGTGRFLVDPAAAFFISRRSSHRSASFVEDQAPDVVGEIGEADLHPGAHDADGADAERHRALLLSEDVLDPGPDL